MSDRTDELGAIIPFTANRLPTLSPSLNQLFILKLILEEWQDTEEEERGTDTVLTFIIDTLEHLAFLYQHKGIDTPEGYILEHLNMYKGFLKHPNEDDVDGWTRAYDFWLDKATAFGMRIKEVEEQDENLGVDDWPKNNSPDNGGQP